MALHEPRCHSVEFVQSWVNSLPPLSGSSCQQSSPSGSSSSTSYGRSSLTTSSSELIHNGGCTSLTEASKSPGSADRFHPGHVTQMKPLSATESYKTQSQGCPVDKSPTRQPLRRKDSKLSWMHSNYSSFNSESSSIDILLEERKANPEQVLMNLGFGVCDQSVGARLPVRFLANDTNANGINMQNFIRGHPELGIYHDPESSLAFGEFYTRLPPYYRQVATTDKHTTLHKNFSLNSIDLQSEHSYLPLTMHKSEDGTMFASILTKSNTEQLEKQGFYSEHSSQVSLLNQSSVSSISTNDCTIDSVDTPSPIILNNSPTSPDSCRNPFISNQSSLSDSVFSSTESFTIDQRIRAKLEAIQEKTINEMCDDDLEDGISFVYRRHSDGDLLHQSDIPICEETAHEEINIHEKRKAFARLKSHSFDQEILTQMLKDQLESCNKDIKVAPGMACSNAPVIVTTDASQDDVVEPVLPKQADGLLQVLFNPESFDSVDSDTGTIVPSPYASPYQGMSPNTSRNGSISLLPPMESFELEEVQSCDAGASSTAGITGDELQLPPPTSRQKRAKLQRSVSERSDSDSSGIADIDCKSSHGQTETVGCKATSDCNQSQKTSSRLLLPNFCQKDGSITSSTQTLSTVSARTSTTCLTVLSAQTSRPRRSSESDASDLKYYSVSSSTSTSNCHSPNTSDIKLKAYKDAVIQTDDYTCLSCGCVITTSLSQQSPDWQTNNLPNINCISTHTYQEKATQDSPMSSNIDNSGDGHPMFYITSTYGSDDEASAGHNSININHSAADGFVPCSGSPNCISVPVNAQTDIRPPYSRSVHGMSTDSSVYSMTEYVSDLKDSTASVDEDHQVEEICSEMSRDLKLLKELFEKYNIDHLSSGNDSASQKAVRQEITAGLQLANSALSPDILPSRSHKHSIHPEMSLQNMSLQSMAIEPLSLSVDCPDVTARSKSLNNVADGPSDESNSKPSNHGYHGLSSYTDDSMALSSLRHRHGSVSSAPTSLLSTPNSHTPSSASSSMSRLSAQLKLAESKYRYEKQMADLEIQRNKLALQMKDEEIEYWKSMADQCGVD